VICLLCTYKEAVITYKIFSQVTRNRYSNNRKIKESLDQVPLLNLKDLQITMAMVCLEMDRLCQLDNSGKTLNIIIIIKKGANLGYPPDIKIDKHLRVAQDQSVLDRSHLRCGS